MPQSLQSPDALDDLIASLPVTGAPPPLAPKPETKRYSISDLQDSLRQAGWPEDQIVKMSAIGWHEGAQGSPRANRKASGAENPSGLPEDSVGPWQINWLAHGSRLKKQGISREDLYDPTTNAKVALDLYKDRGYKPWALANQKFHQQYLPMAQKAYSQSDPLDALLKTIPADSAQKVSPAGLQTNLDRKSVVTAQNPNEISVPNQKPQQNAPDQSLAVATPPPIPKEVLAPPPDTSPEMVPIYPRTYDDKSFTGNVGRIIDSGPEAQAAFSQFILENIPHVKGKAVSPDELMKNEALATTFVNLHDYLANNPKAGPKTQTKAIAQMGMDFLKDPNTKGMQLPKILHEAILSAQWTPDEFKALPGSLKQQISQRHAQMQAARTARTPARDLARDATGGMGGAEEGFAGNPMIPVDRASARRAQDAAENFMRVVNEEKQRTVMPGDPNFFQRLIDRGVSKEDARAVVNLGTGPPTPSILQSSSERAQTQAERDEWERHQIKVRAMANSNALTDQLRDKATQRSTLQRVMRLLNPVTEMEALSEEPKARMFTSGAAAAAGQISNTSADLLHLVDTLGDNIEGNNQVAKLTDKMRDLGAYLQGAADIQAKTPGEAYFKSAGTMAGQAEKFALMKGVTKLPFWAIMGGEAALRTQTQPLAVQAKETALGIVQGVAIEYGPGVVAKVLGKMPGVVGSLARQFPNLIGTGTTAGGFGGLAYEETKRKGGSTAEALGAGAGAATAVAALSTIGGGAKELVEEARQAEATPERLRDILGGRDRALVIDHDGRALSLYGDPKTKGIGGEEISPARAETYAQRGAEEMPVRRVSPEEFDQIKDLVKSKAPKPVENTTKTVTGKTEVQSASSIRSDQGESTPAAPASQRVGVEEPGGSDLHREGQVRQPVEPSEVAPSRQEAVQGETKVAPAPGIARVPVSQLNVDPERFQYKMNPDAKGATGSLEDVEAWNPDLAGTMMVWHDPADGRDYVVNGHNRYALAKRVGQPDVDVRYINAATDREARARGALVNIAEGQGTVLDAAKFFRDSGHTPEDLTKQGISLKKSIARDGLALSKLNPFVFNQVVQGELKPEIGALIGDKISSPDLQDQALKAIKAAEAKGHRLDKATVDEMLDAMTSAPRVQETDRTLFGDITSERSLVTERAQVAAALKRQLAADKSLFGTAARQSQRLAEGGTVVDVAQAKALKESAEEASGIFDTLKNRSGLISDILDEGARSVASGKRPDQVAKENYERIKQAVQTVLGRGTGSERAGSEAVTRRSEGAGGQRSLVEAAGEAPVSAGEGIGQALEGRRGLPSEIEAKYRKAAEKEARDRVAAEQPAQVERRGPDRLTDEEYQAKLRESGVGHGTPREQLGQIGKPAESEVSLPQAPPDTVRRVHGTSADSVQSIFNDGLRYQGTIHDTTASLETAGDLGAYTKSTGRTAGKDDATIIVDIPKAEFQRQEGMAGRGEYERGTLKPESIAGAVVDGKFVPNPNYKTTSKEAPKLFFSDGTEVERTGEVRVPDEGEFYLSHGRVRKRVSAADPGDEAEEILRPKTTETREPDELDKMLAEMPKEDVTRGRQTEEVQSKALPPAKGADDAKAVGAATPTGAPGERSSVRQSGAEPESTGRSTARPNKPGKKEKAGRPTDVNQTSPAFQNWWEGQGPRGRDAIRAYLETGSAGQAIGAWKDAASGVKMNDKQIKAAVNNLIEETDRRLSSEAGAVNFGEIYGVVSNLIQRARDQMTIDPVPGLQRVGVSTQARQHAAARTATPYVVRDILAKVFPDEYANPEAMARTIDVINKDNILGGYDEFLRLAREASAAQDADMAQRWQNLADAIGDKQDIARLESDVEAAKQNPQIVANIDRWNHVVNPELDRMYNEMKRVDPDTAREGRGRVFGARVNLLPESRAAEMKNFGDLNKPMPEAGSSSYRNPNVKKDKFMRLARFTGQYSTDAEAVLTNVIGPRWNEVTKLRLFDGLTDSGAAVEMDYGEVPPAKIQGHKVARLPIKVPETSSESGLTRMVEKVLYVRGDLVGEIRAVLGTDMSLPSNPLFRFLTTIQLAQLTDMTAHLKNIHTVLASAPATRSAFTDGLRRLPVVGTVDATARIVNVTRDIIADTPESRAEQAKMAKLGLIRPAYPLTGLQKITRGQQVIHHVDTASRIVMNRFFDDLVKAGRVKDTEENRASFVQQIGEYNRRLMGPIMRALKDVGFAPFVVAGRNFNRQARRLLTGNPGVEASTLGESAKMRLVNILSGLVAASVLPALLNLLTTNHLGGRPGTPIGAWDLGKPEDERGRHRVIDLMQIVGIRRGLRGTGAGALVEGLREGQTWDEIIGHAGQDVASTVMHPWMGPALGFGYQTVTGKRLDLRGGPEAPEALNVGGGGKQYIENARTALENQNPLLAGALSPLTAPVEPEDSYPTRLWKGFIKGPTSAAGVYDLQSPAQKILSEDRRRRGAFSRTVSQAETMQIKDKLHEDERAGKNISSSLEQAVADGKLTLRQAHDFHTNQGMSPLALQIKYAPLNDATIRAFEVMTDEQKDDTRVTMALKLEGAKPEFFTDDMRTRLEKDGFTIPAKIGSQRKVSESRRETQKTRKETKAVKRWLPPETRPTPNPNRRYQVTPR